MIIQQVKKKKKMQFTLDLTIDVFTEDELATDTIIIIQRQYELGVNKRMVCVCVCVLVNLFLPLLLKLILKLIQVYQLRSQPSCQSPWNQSAALGCQNHTSPTLKGRGRAGFLPSVQQVTLMSIQALTLFVTVYFEILLLLRIEK